MISILCTGGTISGSRGKSGTIHGTDGINALRKIAPSEEIEFETVTSLLSEDITPKHWEKIGKAAAKKTNEKDGVVITHGTFTMGYTAAALSFSLKDLGKPVVLTGAQQPVKEDLESARQNLEDSIKLANSDFSGVCVLFRKDNRTSQFHSGTRVRKEYAWEAHPYRSVGTCPLGKVGGGRIKFFGEHGKRKDTETVFEGGFDGKVAVVNIHPGFDPELLEHAADKYHGIILEGYADGSAPTGECSIIPALESAREKQLPVFAASQPEGQVTLKEYESGLKMLKAGAIPLGDMAWETALVKLMWALDKTREYGKVRELMLRNLAGEITEGSWNKHVW